MNERYMTGGNNYYAVVVAPFVQDSLQFSYGEQVLLVPVFNSGTCYVSKRNQKAAMLPLKEVRTLFWWRQDQSQGYTNLLSEFERTNHASTSRQEA